MQNLKIQYKQTERNNFFLPKIKSSLVNRQYLLDVSNNKVFSLKHDKVQIRPCPDPPKKERLVQYLEDEIQRMDEPKPSGFDLMHMPDTTWLINAISSLNPNHAIFQKSYMPPADDMRRAPKVEEKIDLPADFLNDLPEYKCKSKRKNGALKGSKGPTQVKVKLEKTNLTLKQEKVITEKVQNYQDSLQKQLNKRAIASKKKGG